MLTTLREAGHQVKLIHLTQIGHIDKHHIVNQIKEFAPELVGFSSMSPNYRHARTINHFIKSELAVKTVIGGCHAQFSPIKVLNDGFDFVCIGEGEAILPPLFAAIESGQENDIQFPGILTKKYPSLISPEKCTVNDLNTLPIPDRSFFDYPALRESLERQAQFMAGRGCPFECTYCANKIRNQMFGTYKTRMKNPQRFIEEIRGVLQQHSFIDNIFFQDDILPLNKAWFAEFASLYEKDVKLPFACNIHPTLINEEVMQMLKNMGCLSIQIGVESGCERVRTAILNRRMTNEDIISRVKMCEHFGIKVATFNMLGNYSETFDEALATIKLNAKLGPVRAYSTIFIPYPGTSINQLCNENSAYISGAEPEDFPEYTEEPILKTPDFPPEKVVFLKNWFAVLIRLYKCFPEETVDKILHRKRFPFKLINKVTKMARPWAIRLYLGIYVKFRNRFK
jgi:radical SAM superfamily enzyme YgiQ (UPF0313 family)